MLPLLGSLRRCFTGLLLGMTAGLAACGGGQNATSGSTGDAATADVSVLMMGNSHTSLGALPEQLSQLLQAGLPGKKVAIVVAPGWLFLDERAGDTPTLTLLQSQRWTAVVLQAQKYSSSGLVDYPTDGAEQLVKISRAQSALPVMFPEWPRFGVDETQRIYALHVGIAQRQPACVPPIGQAWDLALQRHPQLRLHDADGNHANTAGAYLSALMLYAGITGGSPRTLPNLNFGVSAEDQAMLRSAAADTLSQISARQHCPNDARLIP